MAKIAQARAALEEVEQLREKVAELEERLEQARTVFAEQQAEIERLTTPAPAPAPEPKPQTRRK